MSARTVVADEQDSPWLRLAPWAAIFFGVLFVVGWFTGVETPDNDDPQGWTTYFADSGNQTQLIVGGYLMIASILGFVWFARGLLARAAFSPSNSSFLSGIASATSTLFAAFAMAAIILSVSVAASMKFGSADFPGPEIAIQFEQLAFGMLLIGGCLSFAGFIAAISAMGRRARALPGWFVWVGFVFAFLLLFGPAFFPIALVPLWAIIAGIVLMTRPAPTPVAV